MGSNIFSIFMTIDTDNLMQSVLLFNGGVTHVCALYDIVFIQNECGI